MNEAPRAGSSAPRSIQPRKPRALCPGSALAVFAPSSPADDRRTAAGLEELQRLRYVVTYRDVRAPDGYFAAPAAERRVEFLSKLADPGVHGLVTLRGGYGSNSLLDGLSPECLGAPKCVIGFSDVTTLHIFLWERRGWVSFYGPMVAAGFDAGAGAEGGYDESSFLRAVSETQGGWSLPLQGETKIAGQAEGRVLGGCLTLLEATIGAPWELDTEGSILLLEDRAMKPYQVDRVLMHLRQAKKFEGVRGIVLGDFPECEPLVAGSWGVEDVFRRILGPLGVPVVAGVPIGHTQRPLLTIPLGIRARLIAQGEGQLEFLEPAVVP